MKITSNDSGSDGESYRKEHISRTGSRLADRGGSSQGPPPKVSRPSLERGKTRLARIESQKICDALLVLLKGDQTKEKYDQFLADEQWLGAFTPRSQAKKNQDRATKGNIFHHLVRGAAGSSWKKEYLGRVLVWFLQGKTGVSPLGDESIAEATVVNDKPNDSLQPPKPPFLDLLEEQDSTNTTALHMALAGSGGNANPTFVEAILELDPPPDNLAKVLCIPIKRDTNETNCLHAAISGGSEFIERVIEHMVQNTPKPIPRTWKHPFDAKEPNTNSTPLHLAIKNAPTTSLESLWKQLRPDTLELLNNERAKDNRSTFSSDGKDGVRYLAIIEKLVEARETVLTTKNGKERTPYQQRLHRLSSRWRSSNHNRSSNHSRRREDDASSSESESDGEEMIHDKTFRDFVVRDPVASFISYYCIKKMDRNKAVSCLYPPGQELLIDFTLEGFSHSSIPTFFLGNLKTHAKFERTLKHVTLPRLTMAKSDTRDSNAKSVANFQGRDDMKTVFSWLRDGGVHKILKVTVVDDELPAHIDQAIVDCLKGFDVEEWDWKKVDISSKVIADSTSVVKKIILYSSGNHAVLMGWCAPDGFANKSKFPELRSIDIYLREGQERKETLKDYGKMVVSALEAQPKSKNPSNSTEMSIGDGLKVRCIVELNSRSSSSQTRTGENTSDSGNLRIDQIKELTAFLRKIDLKGAKPARRVKIAIVDDGLNTSREIMGFQHAKIQIGNSFSPSSPDYASPYFVPSGNHGTQIASLICQLCPRTELYIARLEEQYTQSGYRVISAESATKAVEWAAYCRVDIICMSWTIDRPGQDSEPKGLKDAIDKAKNQGIVMFCAASDQGGSSTGKCYPGAFQNTCIRIGSCSSSDVAPSWVRDELVDFLLPGENILIQDGDGAIQPLNGSSFATAIASGLGGLLMYYGLLLERNQGLQEGNITQHNEDTESDSEDDQIAIKDEHKWTYEEMMLVLQNCSLDVSGGKKLVKPEHFIIKSYLSALGELIGERQAKGRGSMARQSWHLQSLVALRNVFHDLTKREKSQY